MSVTRRRSFASTSVSAKGTKTTTKKNFSDLPESYVNPSGIPAAPLPKWPDGIPLLFGNEKTAEKPSKPPRKARQKKNVVQQDISQDTTSGSESPTAHKNVKTGTYLSQQILNNLKRFPHCLLLTRVGQFYESYFEQAKEISHLLNIKLTSRKWNGKRVPMCGFPLLHLDKHLKTLVQQENRFVAMCEEYPRHISANVREFERRIARIITPGTLIDESFLIPSQNNYLLAISLSAQSAPIGLAWIDISTGEFFSKQCIFENISDELARIAPREVVLDHTLRSHKDHPIFSKFSRDRCLVSYSSSHSSSLVSDYFGEPLPIPKPPVGESIMSPPNSVPLNAMTAPEHSSLLTSSAEESLAIGLLTTYLRNNLLEHMPVLDPPLHENIQDRMQIDSHTIQGLEIRESLYEGSSKGSLLSIAKRTTTTGGARLLARWLCSPSTSVPEINRRLSLVAFFHHRTQFRMDICDILKEAEDVGRLCQRFLVGRADVSDLMAIHDSIGIWSTLRKRCEQEKAMEAAENIPNPDEWKGIDDLFSCMTNLEYLSDKIAKAVVIDSNDDDAVLDVDMMNVESPDVSVEKDDLKKWSINANFSLKLKILHNTLEELLQEKSSMELALRSQYDAPSLTLRSAPGQGPFIHLSRSKRDKRKLDIDPVFYSLGETLTTKSYILRDWSHLGNKIAETWFALSIAEKEAFELLRFDVTEHARHLRQNSKVIDELDVVISFALLAADMNFVRPEIRDDCTYHVVNGRHPSVELGLLSSGRQFTPNSMEMSPASNIQIITGPNMAGKSTVLRQTAIIVILAQVGSFVPADFASISVVDKLFSRIGAKDDLYNDRSTFMVEMLETADILNRATNKSLVIMDEVGRGTTVKDGLAISFAALHHLATVNQSRCLFATHFHELAAMVGNADNLRGTGVFSNIRFYCSDVDDTDDGHFTYSYRLRPGINRDSHGLKVARLAGIPSSAMDVATDALVWLQNKGTDSIKNDYKNFLESAVKSIT